MRVVVALIGFIATLFVAVIAGTFFGGVISWCVSLAFPVVHDTLNTLTGLKLDAFDQGACLGFVGGFLRAKVTQNNG